MPDEPKLDADKVLKLAKDLMEEQGFQNRNTVMETRRRLRYGEEPVRLQRVATSIEYRTGLIDENIHYYQTAISMATLVLRAVSRGDDAADIERARRVYDACMCLWAATHRRQVGASASVPERVADAQPGDGIGWYHMRISPKAFEMLAGKPLEELRGMVEGDGLDFIPFVIEGCDPTTVYYSRDMSAIAQVGKVHASHLIQFHPNLKFKDGRYYLDSEPVPPEQADEIWKRPIDLYHVETAGYIYDLIRQPEGWGTGGEALELDCQVNIFGRPSFVPVPARVTVSADPLKAYQPAVVNLYKIAPQKNRLGSLQQSAAEMTGTPQYYQRRVGTRGENAEDWLLEPNAERTVVEIGTGAAEVFPKPGYEFVQIKLEAGIDLVRAKEDLDKEWFQSEFPAALRSPSEVRVTSGYDRAKIEEVMGKEIGYLLKHQAAAWHELFLLFAAGLKGLDISLSLRTVAEAAAVPGSPSWYEGGAQGVSSREIVISPEDFEGIDLETQLSSLSQAARIALQEEGMRQMALGVVSKHEFLRDFRRVENPERLIGELYTEDVKDAAIQAVKEAVILRIRKEMGLTPGPPEEGEKVSPTRRPPKGAASPGAGATLVQPETPKVPGGATPALPGSEGESA